MSVSRAAVWFHIVCLSCVVCGCSYALEMNDTVRPAPATGLRPARVELVQADVHSLAGAHLASQSALVGRALAEAQASSPPFARRHLLDGLANPWAGLASLERQGLLIAHTAEAGVEALPALIEVLESGVDRTAAWFDPVPFPQSASAENWIGFLVGVLEAASHAREKALRHLNPDERAFLFEHSQTLVETFVPQISEVNRTTQTHVEHMLRFVGLLANKVEFAWLTAAAQELARFGNDAFLRRFSVALSLDRVQTASIPGITGDVLLARETAYGYVVIGGTGVNSYDLAGDVGLLIDLGGNDVYRGVIGATTREDLGNSVVIDLEGDDSYTSTVLGLATGRLGVGLVIDRAGNDIYTLAPGSGGAGFGGLGILYDGAGQDVYQGSRLTQGMAIGGLGLLQDQAGDDRYSSHGYALGFGAPLGVGAIIDGSGDDTFHCGEGIPSNYNAQDAPQAVPGDPEFQYDCFGMGAGSGIRVWTEKKPDRTRSIAGGWGMMLDLGGKDQYRAANFSQGLGYYYGIGTKMDFGGDDDHGAARYGHGAAAHAGLALFIDAQGTDRYLSTGPFYNAGVAWDQSVALALDAGTENDSYDFRRSTGLGMADLQGWAMFIDEAGNDDYQTSNGLGRTSDGSVAAFFDLAGQDDYRGSVSPQAGEALPARGNRALHQDETGGLFVDR